MSLAAGFDSQAPALELELVEVELIAPAAEFAVVVAQICPEVAGKAASLQPVEVEQTVETGFGLLYPLKAVEEIASVGLPSQLDWPLAKQSQEQLLQLVQQTLEKMTVEPLRELVGGLVGEQLVEFQSWPLLGLPVAKLFAAAEKMSLAAEVMAGR